MVNSKYISEKYNSLVNSKKVINDPGQKEVIQSLDYLYYSIKSPFSLKDIFKKKKIMGVYIYGEVGRGKSFLMDIFYQSIIGKKTLRIHQHVFMYKTFDYLNKANSLNIKNPFKYAIDKLIKNISILCVDEFEVLDVADAMILERLYQELYKKGIKVVLTSNTEPNLLYMNGLQRNRFIPFIDLINNLMIINKIGEGKDHRIMKQKRNDIKNFQEFYFINVNVKLLEKLFLFLSDNKNVSSLYLEYNNRKFHVTKSSNNVAFFNFNELCKENYSNVDYIKLAERFSWLIINNIPKLSVNDRNMAKRFQSLIDIMYDEKIGIAVSSEVKPKDIYQLGDGSKEFNRTVSRLYEMTNRSWLNKIKDKRFIKLFDM